MRHLVNVFFHFHARVPVTILVLEMSELPLDILLSQPVIGGCLSPASKCNNWKPQLSLAASKPMT